jgi:hypothetical protein
VTQLLFIPLLHLLSLLHPFFVSLTEVRHNEKSSSLEISCRIFYDDLEVALENAYQVKIDILKPSDREQVNQLIQRYLNQHLQITVDGKLQTLKLLGYEIEEDAAWCYLEVQGVKQVKRMEIHNEVLFAEHRTQTNILHVVVNGTRKSTKLDNPNNKASFSF